MLAACGGGNAAHVVQSSPAVVSGASTNPTQPSGSSGGAGGTGSAGTIGGSSGSSASGAASAPLNDQTLDQVSAELNQLDNSLNQATTDHNNSQGDS